MEYLIGNAALATVNFTPAYTGLSTVAYKIVNSDKTTNVDWTTASVTELESGTGLYGVQLASNLLSTEAAMSIRWRTASSAGIYAQEDLIVKNPPASSAAYTTARAAKLDKLVGDTPAIRDAE